MKTAVEWFIEQIKKDSNLRLRGFDLDGIGEQAKELEKQQIIDAYKIFLDTTLPNEVYEQYYNETFKKK